MDLNIFQIVFRVQIDICYYTHAGGDHVRKIFHELLGLSKAAGFAVIILSDVQGATLSVCITSNPFKVFVPPALLIFDCLVFVTHILNLIF